MAVVSPGPITVMSLKQWLATLPCANWHSWRKVADSRNLTSYRINNKSTIDDYQNGITKSKTRTSSFDSWPTPGLAQTAESGRHRSSRGRHDGQPVSSRAKQEAHKMSPPNSLGTLSNVGATNFWPKLMQQRLQCWKVATKAEKGNEAASLQWHRVGFGRAGWAAGKRCGSWAMKTGVGTDSLIGRKHQLDQLGWRQFSDFKMQTSDWDAQRDGVVDDDGRGQRQRLWRWRSLRRWGCVTDRSASRSLGVGCTVQSRQSPTIYCFLQLTQRK